MHIFFPWAFYTNHYFYLYIDALILFFVCVVFFKLRADGNQNPINLKR